MAKFISLVNYTAKGVENIKESPARLDAARGLAESMGATVEGFYLTMGRYNIVYILDAPDADTAARFILKLTSSGYVSSETLPAYPEESYREIIAGIP